MNLWRELIGENPMLFDLKRFFRRTFLGRNSSALNIAILVLCGLVYVSVLILAGTQSGIELPFIGGFLMSLYLIVVPPVMQGAIAGERERRSWEMLCVAPISRRQIVAGKFVTGAMLVIGIAALVGLPMLLNVGLAATTGQYRQANTFSELLREQAVCVSFGLLLVSVALFVSAHCKRCITSLASTYAVLALFLAFLPALVAPLCRGGEDAKFWYYLHPYYALLGITDTTLLGTGFGLTQAVVYLAVTGAMLLWTSSALYDADGRMATFREQRQTDA